MYKELLESLILTIRTSLTVSLSTGLRDVYETHRSRYAYNDTTSVHVCTTTMENTWIIQLILVCMCIYIQLNHIAFILVPINVLLSIF